MAPESAGELQWWSIFYSLVHGSFSGVGGTRAGAPPPPLGRAAEAGCVRAVSVHAGDRCCAFVCHVGLGSAGIWAEFEASCLGRGARCAMVVFALQGKILIFNFNFQSCASGGAADYHRTNRCAVLGGRRAVREVQDVGGLAVTSYWGVGDAGMRSGWAGVLLLPQRTELTNDGTTDGKGGVKPWPDGQQH